jgi:DNA-binding transcriptional MerR regulator
MNPLWRLDELQARTAAALQAATVGEVNSGRVRDVPDARTIRYYTTLGLLDRPAEMRGRTAYYGRRHLLQLVALKRLQTTGASLADIQQRLVNISSRRLNELAAVPESFWEETTAPSTKPELVAREAFWKAPAATAREPVIESPIVVARLPLGDGVTLEISGDAAQRLTAETVAQLATQLAALKNELTRLGVTTGQPIN